MEIIESLVSVIISVALLLFAILLGFVIAKIINCYADRKRANLRKKHPHLYELIAERDKGSEREHKFWKEYYFNPKTEIDNILDNERYCTIDQRAKNEARLEELREKIAYYHAHFEELREPLCKLQRQISEYAEKNNLKNY